MRQKMQSSDMVAIGFPGVKVNYVAPSSFNSIAPRRSLSQAPVASCHSPDPEPSPHYSDSRRERDKKDPWGRHKSGSSQDQNVAQSKPSAAERCQDCGMLLPAR